MIYNTLDYLPIKIFIKIQETGNLSLLATVDEDVSNEELQILFDKLSDEFQQLNGEDNSSRNFMILKEISHLEAKLKTAMCGIEILRFEANNSVMLALSELLNVTIRTNRTDYYFKDLERAESKARLINKSIEKLRDQLPKKEETKFDSIDDTLAAIAMITGVSFDFNALSCTAYAALIKQTKQKVKAQEESINKLKNK
ncbi:hypothetical protein EG240_05850 [Paenimyroides tangerinum]|uniref:Uncharacterized protein n=1 Tax=Paenimyroides tangerinum TaxID=2488728 RepID=A0A3P3WAS2_9FLAO|nr:hypothetical protein [Paenimyroides tangerinum]RRJ91528.1 hypothetical protein EG240_05850 [Paenimyroides tangerinum]